MRHTVCLVLTKSLITLCVHRVVLAVYSGPAVDYLINWVDLNVFVMIPRSGSGVII